MDAVTEEQGRAIEMELCKRVVGEFNLDWSGLLYDTTNVLYKGAAQPDKALPHLELTLPSVLTNLLKTLS